MIGTSKNIWGFDPRSVPGCSLWLDGADQTSMTFSGSTITQWNDKSVRGISIPSTGTPTITTVNGRSSVSFNGSSYFTRSNFTGLFNSSYVSWIVVANVTNSASASYLSLVGTTYQNNNFAENQLYINSGNITLFYRGSNGGASRSDTVSLKSGINILQTITNFTDGTYQIYQNGTGSTVRTGGPTSLATSEAINLTIGHDLYPGDTILVGTISEILLYTQVLTTSQRQQVEGYLANKWGLTGYYDSSIPLSISGCQVWFDGADTSTITGSSTVTAWRDKSSNSWNATTLIGTAPTNTTVNGINAVSFSGQSTLTVSNVTFSSVQSRAIFVVYRVPTSAPNYISWFSTQTFNINNQGGHNNLVYPSGGGGPYLQSYAVGGAVQGMGADPAVSTIGTTALAVMVHSAVSTLSNVVTLNGTSYALTTNTLASGYGSGTVTYYIGNAYPQAYILCEYILYQKEFNVAERQSIEGYLMKKWGISSSIPSTHPFYSVRPHLRVFQPTDIDGCQLWLDAADSSTLTLEAANKVSAWVDKSINRFVMSNATTLTQPTYVTSGWNGSYPAVRVNGNISGQHNFLSNAAFNGFNTTTWDIYAVVKHSATNQQSGIMWIDPSGSFIIITSDIGTGQFVYTTLSNFNWRLNPTTGTATTQNPYIFQNYSTGTTLGRRLNGVQPGLSEQIASVSWTARTGTYSFFLANPSGGWSAPTTHFGELLMFNRTLSNSERLQIEGYLSTKWGLTQTSFSSTVFNPTSITGCQLWFDASDTASLTPSSITNGTKVSQWNDKSGNNRHMSNSTAASQPTYSTINFNGSLPSVYFRGTTELGSTNANILSNASSTVFNSTTWDIYIAFKPTGGQEAIFWNDPTSAVVVICGNTKIYEQNYSVHYGGWRLAPNDGACRGGECQLYQVYSTGTTLGKRVNGGFEGSQTQTASFSWPSRSSNSQLAFCRPSSGGWSEGNLAIAELIVYNTALSDANRSNVESYLTNKWKIGRGLQLGHPYYSFPSASIPFSPRNISGLQLWLDGADQSSMVLSGTNVTQWNDKSGIGNNAVGTVAPTYDSTSRYVLFNGSSQYFTLPNGTFPFGNTPYSIFVVAYTRNAASAQWVLAGGNETTNQAIGLLFYTTNAVWHSWWVTEYKVDNSITNNVSAIINISYSTTRSIIVNGGTASVNSPGATRANPNTSNFIGRRAGGQFFDGGLAECIVFNSEIPLSQRRQVEGYLAHKWRLAESLPSTHPFKKIPA
jgi:hypothetical protein